LTQYYLSAYTRPGENRQEWSGPISHIPICVWLYHHVILLEDILWQGCPGLGPLSKNGQIPGPHFNRASVESVAGCIIAICEKFEIYVFARPL